MKTAVLICRVSTDKQDNDRQLFDLNNYCKKENIKILKSIEAKVSGAKKNRKEINDLFDFISTNKVDYVIISELSRLGRTNEVLDIIDKLNEKKICLVSLKEHFFTLNEDGSENNQANLTIGIMASLNKFELSTIKYRITSGKNKAVLSGNWQGGKFYPFGYKSVDKRLVINEIEAEIVKMIFQKFADGWGTVKICNYLKDNNIKTRTNKDSFIPVTINSMLRNPIYIGVKRWNNDTISFPELRIIDDYLFNTVQDRLKNSLNNDNEVNKKKKHFYLLDNKILKCGKCGLPMVGIHRDNVYFCKSTKYGACCGNKGVNIPKTDFAIQEYLSKNWLSLVSEKSQSQNNIEKINIDLKTAILDKSKEEKKLIRLNDIYIDSIITKTEFEAKRAKSLEYISKIDNQIQDLNKQIQANKLKSINLTKASFELIEGEYKATKYSIDKITLHKVIKQITALNKVLNVELINGVKFEIDLNK